MRESLNHIISKFSWDTSFDRKEQAFELQERLSGWSRFVMPNELGDVFNKICPPDQTWRIQSLEIDLGKIDFDNLEFELSAKLRSQLREKLTDLIVYAGRSNKNIEIFNGDIAHIQMIRGFLLSGLMPWGYKPTDGTVNEMLHNQLQNNRQQLIAMLKEVGVTHLNVRKRIAYQINESNIIKIVEGLEPNNHAQIVDFSNEFTKIQAQETIVQTSIADFKRNLWLWVFNFLFTERGTVFNKVAFMKSSIIQMADHYDIGYDVLFEMIERAVEVVSQRSNVKADFLLTLKVLSKENRSFNVSTDKKNERAANLWFLLESYFKTTAALKPGLNDIGFDELVVSLFRQDKARFTNLIWSLGYTEDLWLNVIANLNDPSLEIIFAALNATKSAMLAAQIDFFEKISRGLNLNIDREILWQIGFKFLFHHKNAANDNLLFIEYCIGELSKRNDVPAVHLLNRLTGAKIPSAAKTMAGLDIYTDLTSVFISEISGDKATFLVSNCRELIDALCNQSVTATIERRLFISLQKLFEKNIRLNPQIAFEALLTYPDKEKLQKIIPAVLNEQLIALLLKKAGTEQYAIISLIQEILAAQASNKKGFRTTLLNEKYIAGLALNAIILNPQIGAEKLLEFIMDELSKKSGGTMFRNFGGFVEMVLGSKALRMHGISNAVSTRLNERYNTNEDLKVLVRVAQLINKSVNNKAVIAGILRNNIGEQEFVEARRSRTEEGKTILNYLVKNGSQLMESLIKENKAILLTKLKQVGGNRIELILNELYWRCLLNYSDHNGSSAALIKSFKTAIFFRFPMPVNQRETAPDAIKYFQLKNGDKIAKDELLLFIESCLEDGTAVISRGDKKFYLSELLNIALMQYPAAIRNIITKIGVSENLIELFKAEITLEHFNFWIINDAPGTMSKALRSVNQLYDLLKHAVPGDISAELHHTFWETSLTILKTGLWTTADLNKLVQKSFQNIGKQSPVNAAALVSEIKAKNILLTPALKNVLNAQIPALSKLPLNYGNKSISKKLVQVEQKGLLNELSLYLINQKQVPAWFAKADDFDADELLNEMITYYPASFLQVLKNELITDVQLDWLCQTLSFEVLTKSIGRANKSKQSLLSIYEDFYKALGNVAVSGISANEIQGFLFKKILKAWATGNWKIISTENIWNELVWDICTKRGISKKLFINSFAKVKTQLPAALQISFGFLAEQIKPPVIVMAKEAILKSPERMTMEKDNQRMAKEGIAVANAGLVLINSYIAMLFERLEITKDGAFKDGECQQDAIHYLQYVVTGLSNTEEALLPLNKVLCGMPISQPVKDGITIADEQKELIEGLIKAVINYWPAIGQCSIDGFRGNWLVRDGLLTEQDDRWELIVEKRAYDLLINRSPFSFSIIKHPWMKKPLHVTWPY